MHIGILQCDAVRAAWRDRFDDYPDMFAALLRGQDARLTFATYRLTDGAQPATADACDAYVITGSRAGVYEGHGWIAPAEELMRRLIAARRPLVGICFGHQLLARAFGGRVEKSDKGWGIGVHHWQVLEQPWWMAGEAGDFSLLAMHQDQVVDLPEGAVVIARSDFCGVAAFQYGDYALGLQGHPEFSKDYLRELMALRRASFGEQAYCEGLASLLADPDAGRVARWMLRFMRGRQRSAEKRKF